MGRIALHEYPDIGIGEAIKIVEKIRQELYPLGFEEESEEELDSEQIVKRVAELLGHKSAKSGRFREKIAALNRYGLLDDDNVPTDLATRILYPTSDDDQQYALVEARDNIELFRKLVNAKINLASDNEARSIIRNFTDAGNNYQKDIDKVINILKEFTGFITPKNWYGRVVDNSKLEKNLERLENPKLAETASAAIWAQFQGSPSSAMQIMKVFDALQKSTDNHVTIDLLKAIRDGLNSPILDEHDTAKLADYLTDIITSYYHLDSHDRRVRLSLIAIEALAQLQTNRNFDRLLNYLFECCKKSDIIRTLGRPEELLQYLAYIDKEKLVEAMWKEMEQVDQDRYRYELKNLLEKVGEIKIWE